MSQSNEITTTGATWAGIESTPGTTPGSMVRIYPDAGGERDEQQPALQDGSLQSSLLAVRGSSVKSYKTCSSKMTFRARAPTAQADSASTPTQSWQGLLLRALLGGQSMHAGSAIVAGSTSTVINVTVGHGSRFNVGDVILVGVSGTLECARIKSISTDAITLCYALSGSPAAGQLVIATAGYYPTETNTNTLAWQHARAQNSASQWTHNMLTGGLSFETQRGQLLGFGTDLKGGSWTGPSSQSLSVTAASIGMTTPFANVGAFQLLQPVATTTRTHVNIESIALTVDTGMEHVLDVGGTTEGIVGAMRTSFSASLELMIRHDDAWRSSWDPASPYQFMYCCYQGSGTTRRAAGFYLDGTLEELPAYTNGSSNRGMTRLRMAALGGAMSSVNTDQARSPFLWFMG